MYTHRIFKVYCSTEGRGFACPFIHPPASAGNPDVIFRSGLDLVRPVATS